MPLDLDQFARSLASLGEARALMDKARAYLAAWPDPYRLAHQHAADYLLEHTGKPWTPTRSGGMCSMVRSMPPPPPAGAIPARPGIRCALPSC